MKKLLLLLLIAPVLGFGQIKTNIETDSKRYCELIDKLNSLDSIFDGLVIGVNEVTYLELVETFSLESTWPPEDRAEMKVLFKSYRGGIFEFANKSNDVETNEPILVNTDSLSNIDFINHPSFITTVANKYKMKEEGGIKEKVETKIVEYRIKEDLIYKEMNTILVKYSIGSESNYSKEFTSLTENCY